MKTILRGHTSFETAYKVENYPFGFRKKTTLHIWIESVAKKGDRVWRQTIDPSTGKLCAAKASTFDNIKWLFLDEQNHVQSSGLSIYSKKEVVEHCINLIGLDNLNALQRIQYNSLMGINEIKVDEFTGKAKKDFSVKWEKETIGNGWVKNAEGERVWNKGEKGKCVEVKITFDRPDGVTLKEIFEAMKTLNQDRLNEVFEIREDKHFGDHAGVVRICTRGGNYLGAISEEEYKNYLASDDNIVKEEATI